MGRPHRAAQGGYVYHVLNRANARMRIFGARKALSWASLRFCRCAHDERNYWRVVFCDLVVQDWKAAGTSRSAEVVRSRHPGRYPKLEGSTLSHPAFEPLTEHHAFSTGFCHGARAPSLSLGVKTMLSVWLAARQVSRNPELRTPVIVTFLRQGLPVLRA